MNNLKNIIIGLTGVLLIVLQGCGCDAKNEVLGKYATEDKGIKVKDTTQGNEALNYLKIKSNQTFQIFNHEEDIKISGTWSIKNCEKVENNLGKSVPESTIEFIFKNKKIEGKFSENVLIFIYPNDFYLGRYESMRYDKISEE